MANLLDQPTSVVAGSNGVSVGLRLAVDRPELVARLLLLWPATAGDANVDRLIPVSAGHLLAGETIRGVRDDELSTLTMPVHVMASNPENIVHQHRTVDRLVDAIPNATRISAGFPEPPHPDFTGQLDHFIAAIATHLE